MGMFGKKRVQQEHRDVSPVPAKIETQAPDNKVVIAVPDVLYSLAKEHLIRVGFHNQDSLKRVKPFEIHTITLRKQTKANMPDGWEIEPGGSVAFDENRNKLCVIDADRMEKNELAVGKRYHAFVMPPCRDVSNQFDVETSYVLCIMKSK